MLKIIPPYDFVQIVNEQSVYKYLGVSKGDIKRWVIVGGYMIDYVDQWLLIVSIKKATRLEADSSY